jgi:hypothetical protein
MTWRLILSRAIAVLLLLLCAPSYAQPRDQIQSRENLARWLSEKRAWEDLPAVAAQVSAEEPEVRANAVLAFGTLWDANLALAKPRAFDRRLDYKERRAVVEALETHFGVMGAPGKKRSLEIAASVGYVPELMSLLLIATADPDASVRDTAGEITDGFLKSPIHSKMNLLELVRFLERSNLPAKLSDGAERQLDRAGPAARNVATGWALSDLSINREGAMRALKALHAEDTRLARFASHLSELDRSKIESLFTELPFARNSVIERAIPLLTSKDSELRRLAASFVAADHNRCDPMRVVQACIDTGLPLARDTLESMELDLTTVCDKLATILQSPNTIPIARVAATQTLKLIGLHGNAIWNLANSLLYDDDEEVRYVAGELFNRQDIMNRARIPAILRDLRNDSLTRRMTAANQLESLGVEPKEITAALIRAVQQGDMPAREGLLRAIDRAYTARANSLDTLKKLAADPDEHDPKSRAYARAALRAVATPP